MIDALSEHSMIDILNVNTECDSCTMWTEYDWYTKCEQEVW